MKIKIDINTSVKDGKKRYADVAFFVDREDFLSDLVRLRKKWNLDKLFKYNQYDDWRKKTLTQTEKQKEAMSVAWKNFQKRWHISLGDTAPEQAKEDWIKAHKALPEWEFYFDIDKIRVKYHKPYYFHWIIRRALVCGEIRDKDYSRVCQVHCVNETF